MAHAAGYVKLLFPDRDSRWFPGPSRDDRAAGRWDFPLPHLGEVGKLLRVARDNLRHAVLVALRAHEPGASLPDDGALADEGRVSVAHGAARQDVNRQHESGAAHDGTPISCPFATMDTTHPRGSPWKLAANPYGWTIRRTASCARQSGQPPVALML